MMRLQIVCLHFGYQTDFFVTTVHQNKRP